MLYSNHVGNSLNHAGLNLLASFPNCLIGKLCFVGWQWPICIYSLRTWSQTLGLQSQIEGLNLGSIWRSVELNSALDLELYYSFTKKCSLWFSFKICLHYGDKKN